MGNTRRPRSPWWHQSAATSVAIARQPPSEGQASDLTLVRRPASAADAIRLSWRTVAVHHVQPLVGVRLQHRREPARRGGLPDPELAGAAMAVSSVFVVTRSRRLRSYEALAAIAEVAATPPARRATAGCALNVAARRPTGR